MLSVSSSSSEGLVWNSTLFIYFLPHEHVILRLRLWMSCFFKPTTHRPTFPLQGFLSLPTYAIGASVGHHLWCSPCPFRMSGAHSETSLTLAQGRQHTILQF